MIGAIDIIEVVKQKTRSWTEPSGEIKFFVLSKNMKDK